MRSTRQTADSLGPFNLSNISYFFRSAAYASCWRKAYSKVLLAWYSFRICQFKDKLKLLTHLKAWPVKQLGPLSKLTLHRRRVLSGDLTRSVSNLISNHQAVLWLVCFLTVFLSIHFSIVTFPLLFRKPLKHIACVSVLNLYITREPFSSLAEKQIIQLGFLCSSFTASHYGSASSSRC